MINEALIWDKFYSDIVPEQIWNYKLQQEWAKEALDFYILFNNLTIIDIDKIGAPYVFTKKDIYDVLVNILGFHSKDFELSTNSDGGMLGVYVGPDPSLIMSVELLKDYTLTIDYMQKGISSRTTYSREVPTEFKIKEIERLFTRLFYEWF